MEDNPIDENLNESDNNTLTTSMVNNLKEAFTWMRIVGGIQMAFFVIGTIYILYTIFNNTLLLKYMRGQFFIVILILILGFVLALTLFKAGKAYDDYMRTKDPKYLEVCFIKQKQFWLASGILTIISVVFYVVSFLTRF